MPKQVKKGYETITFSRQELIDLVLSSLTDKSGFKVDFTLSQKLGKDFVEGATCTRTVVFE